MNLQFRPGSALVLLIATLTAPLVANIGRPTWPPEVLVLLVYLIFATTL